MDGKSMDIAGDKLNQLKAILPEAFTENKIDWEKLRAARGDNIEFKNERYVLNWAGKSDAFRALQAPSTATLSPCPDESVHFDQTGNVFIEGENLEVLKVLQKCYFGKIKMIYIDPPYNTGNDHFIYPDRFSESREDYLNRIGDKDETGLMTREGLFRKNSKDGGNRKFICVQLPEKCDENTEAYKAGYSTIAEIGKERIRRVIKKISDDQSGKLDLDGRSAIQDLGFKVFKLRESNFKIWRTAIETEEDLVAQMQQNLEPLDEHAKTEDVLYELLLKAGVPLTADIRSEEGFLLANNGEIALALERADDTIIKRILALKPQKVFTLDRLFKQNDKLKTNTALQMKDAGIEFKVI